VEIGKLYEFLIDERFSEAIAVLKQPLQAISATIGNTLAACEGGTSSTN